MTTMMMEAEAAVPGMEQQHHDQNEMQDEEGEELLMVSTSRFFRSPLDGWGVQTVCYPNCS